MSNGISRQSVYEALKAATDPDGKLDLWAMAEDLADDVESWGEDFEEESNVPRFFSILKVSGP